jgi:hypothetical protein
MLKKPDENGKAPDQGVLSCANDSMIKYVHKAGGRPVFEKD